MVERVADGAGLARRTAPEPGSRAWFEEIDRRFFGAAYFAANGHPSGRRTRSELVERQVTRGGLRHGNPAAALERTDARLTAIDLGNMIVAEGMRRA